MLNIKYIRLYHIFQYKIRYIQKYVPIQHILLNEQVNAILIHIIKFSLNKNGRIKHLQKNRNDSNEKIKTTQVTVQISNKY